MHFTHVRLWFLFYRLSYFLPGVLSTIPPDVDVPKRLTHCASGMNIWQLSFCEILITQSRHSNQDKRLIYRFNSYSGENVFSASLLFHLKPGNLSVISVFGFRISFVFYQESQHAPQVVSSYSVHKINYVGTHTCGSYVICWKKMATCISVKNIY